MCLLHARHSENTNGEMNKTLSLPLRPSQFLCGEVHTTASSMTGHYMGWCGATEGFSVVKSHDHLDLAFCKVFYFISVMTKFITSKEVQDKGMFIVFIFQMFAGESILRNHVGTYFYLKSTEDYSELRAVRESWS